MVPRNSFHVGLLRATEVGDNEQPYHLTNNMRLQWRRYNDFPRLKLDNRSSKSRVICIALSNEAHIGK
jgi:hypothetical protein